MAITLQSQGEASQCGTPEGSPSPARSSSSEKGHLGARMAPSPLWRPALLGKGERAQGLADRPASLLCSARGTAFPGLRFCSPRDIGALVSHPGLRKLELDHRGLLLQAPFPCPVPCCLDHEHPSPEGERSLPDSWRKLLEAPWKNVGKEHTQVKCHTSLFYSSP